MPKKPTESSSLFLAGERAKAMEANDTFEKRYGLTVRPATEEEKNQQGSHFLDEASQGLRKGRMEQGPNRLMRGLRAMANNGVGGVD